MDLEYCIYKCIVGFDLGAPKNKRIKCKRWIFCSFFSSLEQLEIKYGW
jgi:hypothetical protein